MQFDNWSTHCLHYVQRLELPRNGTLHKYIIIVIIIMIILVVVVLNTLLFQPLSSEISFMEAITPVHLKYPKQIVSHMLRARSCVLESDLDIEGGRGWGTDQVCASFYLLQCITSLEQINFQIAMCSYP